MVTGIYKRYFFASALLTSAALFWACSGTTDSDNVGASSSGTEGSVTATIYADNYFELYVNGEQVAVDPLDFTPHQAVQVSFNVPEGTIPVYAILASDFATESGYEYTSTNSPQLGDGGLIAVFSDGQTTGSDWKCYTVLYGPTEASEAAGGSAANLGACEVTDAGIPHGGADTDLAAQAAQVVKADLASEMVYEFPELQGLMGRYYASAAGLPDEVAQAVQAHYSPLGPSDTVPSESVSVSVALADKIDMLAGFWSIDEKPTGSKDPFALRRAALGVIRLLLENKITMPLTEAFALSGSKIDTSDLLGFFHDRLKVFLRDQGLRHDVIDACVSLEGNDDLLLVVNRAKALSEFLASEDGGNLVQGFKRANNILAQAEEKDGVEYSYGADVKFSQSDEERELFASLEVQSKVIKSALKQEDFSKAMSGMAALRAPVDAFFEAVQVNTDNEVVRRNRLNLLNLIRSTCRAVADLTKIEG